MNRFFAEIPTAMARTPELEALHLRRVAFVFADGEMRAGRLELCPIPDSAQVAVSARLEEVGKDPRDGLIQYLTLEGVERIHPDTEANVVGAELSLSLVA
jgi:hypothetical protein